MNVVLAVLVVAGLIFAVALLASLPVMLLWNCLMPDIFGLKEITWLQALGLSLLSSLLVKQSVSTKD